MEAITCPQCHTRYDADEQQLTAGEEYDEAAQAWFFEAAEEHQEHLIRLEAALDRAFSRAYAAQEASIKAQEDDDCPALKVEALELAAKILQARHAALEAETEALREDLEALENLAMRAFREEVQSYLDTHNDTCSEKCHLCSCAEDESLVDGEVCGTEMSALIRPVLEALAS